MSKSERRSERADLLTLRRLLVRRTKAVSCQSRAIRPLLNDSNVHGHTRIGFGPPRKKSEHLLGSDFKAALFALKELRRRLYANVGT